MSVTQLRPLGVGEILDVAITIYRRNFRTLLTLVFVVVAPFEILSALIQASARLPGCRQERGPESPALRVAPKTS